MLELTGLSGADSDISVRDHAGPGSDLLLDILTLNRLGAILWLVDLFIAVGSKAGVLVSERNVTDW